MTTASLHTTGTGSVAVCHAAPALPSMPMAALLNEGESARAPPSGWPVALAATAGSAVITLGLLQGRIAPGAALVLHLGLLLLVLGCLQHRRRYGEHAALLLILTAGCAGLGWVGALGACLAWGLRSRQMDGAHAVADGDATGCPPELAGAASALYQRLLQGEATVAPPHRNTLAPFVDVMRGGMLAQRQAVIGLIAGQYQPAFAAAPAAALSDGEPAVRVQAATAVARLESGWLSDAITLERRHVAGLHQRAGNDDRLALARHHDDHAYSGLLDAERAGAARLRALALYSEVSVDPDAAGDAESLAQARLLTRLGRQTEVIMRLQPAVESGQVGVELLAWYAECLFTLGRFGALRAVCQQYGTPLRDNPVLSPACRTALDLWGVDP